MNLRRLAVLSIVVAELVSLSYGHLVFPVHQKRLNASVAEGVVVRRGRTLSALHFGLGYTLDRMFYAKLALGDPAEEYNVIVDTGSSATWLNCNYCKDCPKEARGAEIKLYNPKKSRGSSLVRCAKSFTCFKDFRYLDGTIITAFFVWDNLKFGQQQADTTRFKFACAVQGRGEEKLLGIVGLDQHPESLVSQLAERGLSRRVFSHCFNQDNNGGIIAIGEVVDPKVKTTPLALNPPGVYYYNVYLKAIDVGGHFLDIPELKSGRGATTTIDSGRSVAYLMTAIAVPLINTILHSHPTLNFTMNEYGSACFVTHEQSVIDEFPNVAFHFENDLTLQVTARDYVLPDAQGSWCLIFVENTYVKEQSNVLGACFLGNKLVVYDIDQQTLGWTSYGCTSNIKVRDNISRAVNSVGATMK